MAKLTPDREKLQPIDRTKSQPVMVPETNVTGYNAPLSSDQQTQTDTISQVYRGSVPVVRLAPLPASGSATANAASNSSAQIISAGSVATGIAINLSMPGEFTAGGTPAGATGTFKVAWAPENALTVFCAPSTAYPFQAATSLSGDSGTASTPNIVPGTVPMLAISAVSAGGSTVTGGTGWTSWPSTMPNIPNVPLFAQVLPSTFPVAGSGSLSPAGFWSAGVLLLAFNKTLATAPVQSTNSSGGWAPPYNYTLTGTTAGNTILVVINFTLTAGVGGISVTVSDGVNSYSHPVSTSSPNPSANTGTQVDMFVAQGIAGGTVNLTVNGFPGIGNASSYEIYILEISGCPSGPGIPSFKTLTGAYIPAIHLDRSGNGGVTGDLPYAQVSGVPAFPATTASVSHEWFNSYNATTGAFTQTQPAFSDISGTAAAAQLPATTSSTLGAIELNTDLGGTATAPQVVSTHLSSPLPVNQGGTGTTTPALVPGTNVTITGSWPNQTINASGGGGGGGVSTKSADYTIASGDNGTLVALSTGSHTFTLPTTPPTSTWTVSVENYGTGTLTLAPGGSTDIDGSASSVSILQNQGVVVFTDGTNYFTERGLTSATAGVSSLNSLTGAVTLAAGTNITLTPSGSTITIAASGGGGSIASGTPLLPCQRFTSSDNNFANDSVWGNFFGSQLVNLPSTWKVVLGCIGGTGVHVAAAVVYRTAPQSLVVVDVNTITFSSSSTYTSSFSGASASAPFLVTSDAISVTLNYSHDYYVVFYFDSDVSGYNAALHLPRTYATPNGLFLGGFSGGNGTTTSIGGTLSPSNNADGVFWAVVAG